MTQKITGRDRGDGAARKALLQQIAVDFPGNGNGAQRARLLAAMRRAGHVTTTEARLYLEIMNPSQRLTELRNQASHIDTAWALEPSEAGRDPRRQACSPGSPAPTTRGGRCDSSGACRLVGAARRLHRPAGGGAALIRALIVGETHADPQRRTGKNGKPFALARLSVPMADVGRVFCSVIAFEAGAVARLLQLRAGASVAAAGTLKVGTWQAKDGAVRPSLDLVADEVAATTPRPGTPKAENREARSDAPAGGDSFAGLSRAGDVDLVEA